MLRKREGTDLIFPLAAGDRMIFAENYAKIIQSPEVGGKIQVSGDSDLSPGLLSFSGNQFFLCPQHGQLVSHKVGTVPADREVSCAHCCGVGK